MSRGGIRTRRIGGALVCAAAVTTALLPAAALGQSAVDEYTLDIPGGTGTNPGDPTAPTGGAGGATAASTGATGSAHGSAGHAAKQEANIGQTAEGSSSS